MPPQTVAAHSAVVRRRKSHFVKLFDKTPPEVVCPHFYELILSNGCPFDCSYCYLKLTFRGQTRPTLFCNDWDEVQRELERVPVGVFSTGELADSLAVEPPLLRPALDFFANQMSRHILLVTKSNRIAPLLERDASPQIIVSFSINSVRLARRLEKGAPTTRKRLESARRLKSEGWRVRVRIDPVVIDDKFDEYERLCHDVAQLDPECVTVGSLRQYPGVHNFSKTAPREGLKRAADGRMRYPEDVRVRIYTKIASWLGFEPALCKETKTVWKALGWRFRMCNCTVDGGFKGGQSV